MAGLWKVRELLVFAWDLLVVACGLVLDALWRARGEPSFVEDLTPRVMSRLLGAPVVSVKKRQDREAAMAGDVAELGAGGTGTCRAWLQVTKKDGVVEHVFVKMPAATVAERMFLTVFRVYPNELNFYMNVRRDPRLPRELFARVYHASKQGNHFCLVLQDLSHVGAAFPGIMDPYPRARLDAALRSLATLHAAFWGAPPQGVWCDEWSRRRTRPATPVAMRPVFRRFVAEHTLKKLVGRYPGLIPADILPAYKLFIARHEEVRRFWSEGPITMCHGDAHYGNMFFLGGPLPKTGFYDMQCVCAEHPMRDVTYHVLSGYDADELKRDEKDIIRSYLAELDAQIQKAGTGSGSGVSFDDAWTQYRLHGWWALAAFAISAGASDLMKEKTARVTIGRICTAMQRVDAVGALHDLLGISSAAK